MSLHGAQKILQFIYAGTGFSLKMQEELYSALYLMIARKKPKEKLTKLAKALWPVVFIQGLPSTHVAIDELGISRLTMQISNPPRQAEIGHLLRGPQGIPSEKLDKILANLRFKDTAKDTPIEEQETQVKNIPGLFPPDFIVGLKTLLPTAFMEDVGAVAVLDSAFNTDQVIGLSEEYRKLHELIRGNEVRWNSIKDLLAEPFNRWVTDLVVELKETQERYDSALNKTDSEIDESLMSTRLKSEKDTTEMWIQREKKRLCTELVEYFRPLAEQLEEIGKSLKKLYFGDAVVSTGVEGTISAVETRIKQLDTSMPQCQEKIKNINKYFKEFLQKMDTVDVRAKEKVQTTENQLVQRLQQKKASMEEIETEKRNVIDQIAKMKEEIDQKFQTIKEIIETKAASCKKEAREVSQWALPDEESKISMPIIRVFLPVYVGLYETTDMEERLIVILPNIFVKDSPGKALSPIHDAFKKFEEDLERKLAEDIKMRSNFEFACETKNLFSDPKYRNQIMKASQEFGKKYFSEEQQKIVKASIE